MSRVFRARSLTNGRAMLGILEEAGWLPVAFTISFWEKSLFACGEGILVSM